MMQSLTQAQRNHSIGLQEISAIYNHKFCISKAQAIYFPYNCDVRDQGWGCAWRAIQLLLTYKSVYITFENLYLIFSKKTRLYQIIRKDRSYDQPTLSLLQKSRWVPEQLDNHWAQPFIASLICSAYQIKNSLFLLNGYPVANAPSAVFQKIIKFKELVQIIKQNINHSSIMIDDGHYALSIIGYRQTSQQTIEFLFADPHIRSNRQDKTIGIYCKQFDYNGVSKGDMRSQRQKLESLYNVYEVLSFQTKNWMICFINK